MAKTVIVGCKLPNGLVIEHPTNKAISVELAGVNSAKILGSTYGTTEVDGDFWDAWAAANADFAPFKSGAMFVARTIGDAAAIAKEQAEIETGLEPLKQEGDKRAGGVKKASSKD